MDVAPNQDMHLKSVRFAASLRTLPRRGYRTQPRVLTLGTAFNEMCPEGAPGGVRPVQAPEYSPSETPAPSGATFRAHPLGTVNPGLKPWAKICNRFAVKFQCKTFVLVGLSIFAASCSVGPNYHRPSAPVPIAYKEYQGWKVAAPNDTINRGAWWSIFRDPILDALERQVEVSNQNIKQAEAALAQAKAIVHEQQSSFFPSVSVTPQVQRQKSGGGLNSEAITSYSLEGTATWEPDIWGKIRRTVEGSVASAQVSAAQLAAAKLSAQAQLATDYFQLRYADALKQLLADTVVGV